MDYSKLTEFGLLFVICLTQTKMIHDLTSVLRRMEGKFDAYFGRGIEARKE